MGAEQGSSRQIDIKEVFSKAHGLRAEQESSRGMEIKDAEQGSAKGMNIKEVLRSRATPAPPRQLPGTTPHLPLPELCHPCTSLELLLLGSRLYSIECLSKLSTPPQTVDRETAGRPTKIILFHLEIKQPCLMTLKLFHP